MTKVPEPAPQIRRMTVKAFRAQGYLQELNRLFMHPLGLALEVIVDDDGTERFGRVWDYRHDSEGIIYGDEPGAWRADAAEVALRIGIERQLILENRNKAFRWPLGVQPVPFEQLVDIRDLIRLGARLVRERRRADPVPLRTHIDEVARDLLAQARKGDT